MHIVLTGLWLGDLESLLDGTVLARAGMTHMVDLANRVHNAVSAHKD